MFYLKYRPQKISELDLQVVRRRLAKVLSGKDVLHAFLFAGPRGAGKTSAARIVAKIVNCQKTEDRSVLRHPFSEIPFPSSVSSLAEIEPCDKCDSCVAIRDGRHLDILEIDAASNRGIDQIRDLRDKIALSPSNARYKVYIIDEVHMLTNEAFNALLKTLEEPPAHAVFILATTEPHRLPETVKSRCVEVTFPKATEAEIVRSLTRVIKGEGLEVEPDAVSLIVRTCDGSFRDAAKLLEEAAVTSKKVELAGIEAVIGGGMAEVDSFLKLLREKNIPTLLSYINNRVEDGQDVFWLTRATLDRLHNEFLSSFGIQTQNSKLKTQNFNRDELIKLMRLLETAAKEERSAVIAQMPLELAVIEWCQEKVKS